jgi:hypothetical protein
MDLGRVTGFIVPPNSPTCTNSTIRYSDSIFSAHPPAPAQRTYELLSSYLAVTDIQVRLPPGESS